MNRPLENHLEDMWKQGKLRQVHLDALYFALTRKRGKNTLLNFRDSMNYGGIEGAPFESILYHSRYAAAIDRVAKNIWKKGDYPDAAKSFEDAYIAAGFLASKEVIRKLFLRPIRLGLIAPIYHDGKEVRILGDNEEHEFLTEYHLRPGKEEGVRAFLKKHRYRV